jgi:hypothetical protein
MFAIVDAENDDFDSMAELFSMTAVLLPDPSPVV